MRRQNAQAVLSVIVWLALAIPGPATWAGETSDLAYGSFVDSDSRLKCLYGYAAEKTGDHRSAMLIFEDCIERWNDVYSMIWLAQMYETGVAVPQDLQKSTALLKRGAEQQDEAGYASLARLHYGVALYEGVGTELDREQGIRYLRLAAEEGVTEACDYLTEQGLDCPQPGEPDTTQ
ncbi:tetratricopeptide repeat protein [Marinobacter zhejiangensis]|uniref:Sel1 repeat-containing protein n=1 Tax=Marinobacter zhejiangensis TaxID=488535 RepID=A0A1I4T3Y1_9GAMM|nr:SEL1-like repeat protein [Marinobacter zhejiangensis]SFM71464.1 Sel1 repeat-containing protein [Marinobacter zhejiangensis]